VHTIEIKNFGPLADINLQLNRIVFLLGEQASGKSTLAKLVYFFRTFQEEFLNLVFASDSENWQKVRSSYASLLRRKFTGIFGETKVLGDFHLIYSYTDIETVIVKPSLKKSQYLDITLSRELDKKLELTWEKARKIHTMNKENAYDIYLNIIKDSVAQKDIISELNSIFNDNAYVTYIPAGRAFLSHQALLRLIAADEIRRIIPNNKFEKNDFAEPSAYDIIDATTRSYIYEANRVREWHLSAQVRESLNTALKNGTSKYLSSLSRNILKGSYSADKYNDYIEIKDGKKIKLSYASSGQQEVIWVLNLLSSYVAEKRRCLLIIEEPETHLYPEAQYMLSKAIASFRNCTDSQILITTHSPYILTSFNNLIYAGECGKSSLAEDKLNEIVPKESWIEPEHFSSYILENGELQNIKDTDLAMIDIAELDKVASTQDTEYEKMLTLASEVKKCAPN
jgi:predicted ATP-dependent endonuclease of OLD family